MKAAGQHLFFLGIGGIGMSALARWFHAQGATVAGYDRTASALTEALIAEGIAVDTSVVGTDFPRSWDLVFGDAGAEYAGQITLLNDPRETLGAALDASN